MEACQLSDPVRNQIGPDRVDRVLLEAIDEALLAIGRGGRTAVYSYLARHYGLKVADLPQKLEVLDEFLSSVFGASTGVMKRLILRQFHSKLGCRHSELDSMPQFVMGLRHARQLVVAACEQPNSSPNRPLLPSANK